MRNETLNARNRLIGFSSGLGARNPGCGDGPASLQAAGIDHYLRSRRIEAHWGQLLYPDPRPAETLMGTVSRLNEALAHEVTQSLKTGERPVVFGGDHTCAVGTWRGTHAGIGGQALGLLWIDAHMDAHTPESSHSGMLHGMPLAMLLGHCGMDVPPCDPVLQPEHIAIVGARSNEPEEAELLQSIGVRIYPMEEVEERGLATVLKEAQERVRRGTAAYGITVDVDSMDPLDAPGVGTPEAGGLRAHDLIEGLRAIVRAAPPVAVEIAEFNPHEDRDGKTVHVVEDLTAALLGEAAKK